MALGGNRDTGISASLLGKGQQVSQSMPGACLAVPPLSQCALCRGPRPGGERKKLLGGGDELPAASSGC